MFCTKTATAGFGVAVLVLVGLAPAALAGPDTAGGGSAVASCPDRGWSDRDPGTDHSTGAANIRTGPGTACTAVGQAQPSHQLDLHCFKNGQGGTWSHVRDTATGKQGWIKDSLLARGGSAYLC
jgi:hypothetical protein